MSKHSGEHKNDDLSGNDNAKRPIPTTELNETALEKITGGTVALHYKPQKPDGTTD